MTRLPIPSRVLAGIAAVLLIGAFAFPLWRIDLEAPQYPEGIGMLIRINTVDGVKENDLDNINGLNHYIGMKAIEPDAIPELRYMPWVLAVLVAGAALAAATARRAVLVGWLAAFATASAAGLADFWRWGYDYGHDIDPNAIIKIPDMTYQPPLIGSKQLLNFTAHSWPALGGILLGVAFLLGVAALVVALRRPAGAALLARRALRAALVIALAACSAPGPRAIAYGEEQCEFCRMTISDPRFGAQVRTATGRIHTFDSIECAASFVNAAAEENLRGVWVSDFERPGTFMSADSAIFWRRDDGGSPMGKGLVATARRTPPAGVAAEAVPFDWAVVRTLIAAEPTRAERPDTAGTVVVSPDGPVRTVAEGVRLAPAGGRVVILAATYREPTVLIDKPLTVQGRGRPTLDGEGQRELIRVRADDVSVRGLRFTRVGVAMTEDRAAVRVTESRRCTIADNHFDDTFFGVYLAKVEACAVDGNVFTGRGELASETMSGNAVHVWSARDVDVRNNTIAGHRDGIYFEFVRHGRVADNVSERNLRYGLHFMYSDSSDYVGNTFRENGSGVAVMYANVIAMRENRFVENRGAAAYGLLLKEIGDPVLERNIFARNTVALMADGATRLAARGNRFAHNGTAVRLMANLQEGQFTGNDFVGNTFDVTTNGRAAEDVAFASNYFGEYRGYDIDRDGSGDVPHRPVRLFSLLVARYEPALVLQRSAFVAMLDAAERVMPSLTPARLADARPSMQPVTLALSERTERAGGGR